MFELLVFHCFGGWFPRLTPASLVELLTFFPVIDRKDRVDFVVILFVGYCHRY